MRSSHGITVSGCPCLPSSTTYYTAWLDWQALAWRMAVHGHFGSSFLSHLDCMYVSPCLLYQVVPPNTLAIQEMLGWRRCTGILPVFEYNMCLYLVISSDYLIDTCRHCKCQSWRWQDTHAYAISYPFYNSKWYHCTDSTRIVAKGYSRQKGRIRGTDDICRERGIMKEPASYLYVEVHSKTFRELYNKTCP